MCIRDSAITITSKNDTARKITFSNNWSFLSFFRRSKRSTEFRMYLYCLLYTSGLKREIKEIETIYGTVHVKAASGYGIVKEKPEYEDMARIAKEKNISLSEVEKEIYKKLSENKAR